MSKWHSLLEVLQFPLKILFIGTLLLGIGTITLNQNVTFLWYIDNQLLIRIFELIRYIGASIIYLFPLLVFVHILSHKYETSVTTIIGILSYILINISIVFFSNTNLPSYFYSSIYNISIIDFDQISSTLFSIRTPYNLGIFSFLLAYGITYICYKISRKYSIFGITSFVDHDSFAGLLTCFVSVICGIVLAFIWPGVIAAMNALFNVIANDITNPVNLFLYGIVERLSALFGMVEIPRSIFWFTDMGGSWLSNVGQKFSGDVAIWTVQRQEGMSVLTTGTFITPYYVINLFIIPAYYIAMYHLCSNKKDKKRYLGFIVLAVVLSILCGNPLPAEILMLILSPMLYFVYIFIIGLLYAFFQIFHIVVGYNFSELLILANPGSGLDLLEYLRSAYVAENIYKLCFVGIIIAIIFYIFTCAYFKKYAFGLFQAVDSNEICAEIVENLGGLDNILDVESTPDKLNVRYDKKELINYDALTKHGAYMMLESKYGYIIRIGNISTMVKDYIVKKKKEQNQNDASN
ncbi:MAG: hypothetical protein ACI4U3_02430 [Traorella sp.]